MGGEKIHLQHVLYLLKKKNLSLSGPHIVQTCSSINHTQGFMEGGEKYEKTDLSWLVGIKVCFNF